ncbi:MAG: hypothetical protein HY696_10600 [Deltaproteobacteria bacterium]|nr:hypothetical protein [Deltaproteobacteria bacterium]
MQKAKCKVQNGRIAGVGLLCLLLAGCFGVDEWTRVDVTGRTTLSATVRMGFSEQMKGMPIGGVDQKLAQAGSGLPGVQIKSVKTEQRDGQLIVTSTVEAARLADLHQFYRQLPPAAGGDPAATSAPELFRSSGFYRVRRVGNRLRFERTLVPPKVAKAKAKAGKKGKKDPFDAQQMTDMMFGGVFIRFAATLPGLIVASNAEHNDAQTAHWVYPLGHLTKKKVTLWAEIAATPELERALLGK